ncbi:glycosyltransferase [Colwellia sp. BRX8-9]|uniref:glycosyltransferase n=1 Tax=Colwellia sp. BRX8-9 TaxID=2759831 RepID=UPI0015F64204|nr:glycosyltransferase [Colwellia sp. BRX8-9]MBA6349475.1 glycosyltransferase [Colwellia sp. BRX8-9]
MKKIYWFANPYSPHVRHWFEALEHSEDLEIELIHIYHKRKVCEINGSRFKVSTPLPHFCRHLPELLQYFLLGIFFRFSNKKNYLVHAHNTSGYGFSALLSGSKYGITTYGSEIYQSKTRGFLYNKLISRVLLKSLFITSASTLMTNSLKTLFSIDESKIFKFSFGVSSAFSYSDSIRSEQRKKLGLLPVDKLFVINRRAAPIYQTDVVVSEFLECYRGKCNYKLFILSGDSEVDYLNKIKKLTTGEDQVTYMEGFMDQVHLSSLLCASDFFISTPISDQLSSSILEGMVCKSIPILTNLSAYNPISTSAILINTTNFRYDLNQTFHKIKEQSKEEYSLLLNIGASVIDDYRVMNVEGKYKDLISEFE